MKIFAIVNKSDWPAIISRMAGVALLVAGVLLAAGLCAASPHDNPVSSIFETHSTPADSIRHLSHFVLGVTAMIFLVVFSLLSYAVVKFRSRVTGTGSEPAQVYGSTQIELAWTVIPILIVAVLSVSGFVASLIEAPPVQTRLWPSRPALFPFHGGGIQASSSSKLPRKARSPISKETGA